MTAKSQATAAASVSVTAEPATATAPVAASVVSLPPAVTVNAAFAGTALVSSASSKVMVSVAPSTDAEATSGPLFAGVSFVTVTAWSPKVSRSLPARSWMGLVLV